MGPRGPLQVSALPHIYLPLEGLNPGLAQRLQPVLVLEPHTGLLHTQLLSGERGLWTVRMIPKHNSHHIIVIITLIGIEIVVIVILILMQKMIHCSN